MTQHCEWNMTDSMDGDRRCQRIGLLCQIAKAESALAEREREIARLRELQAAAEVWRKSMIDDGWTERDILDSARPGMYGVMVALAKLSGDAG